MEFRGDVEQNQGGTGLGMPMPTQPPPAMGPYGMSPVPVPMLNSPPPPGMDYGHQSLQVPAYPVAYEPMLSPTTIEAPAGDGFFMSQDAVQNVSPYLDPVKPNEPATVNRLPFYYPTYGSQHNAADYQPQPPPPSIQEGVQWNVGVNMRTGAGGNASTQFSQMQAGIDQPISQYSPQQPHDLYDQQTAHLLNEDIYRSMRRESLGSMNTFSTISSAAPSINGPGPHRNPMRLSWSQNGVSPTISAFSSMDDTSPYDPLQSQTSPNHLHVVGVGAVPQLQHTSVSRIAARRGSSPYSLGQSPRRGSKRWSNGSTLQGKLGDLHLGTLPSGLGVSGAGTSPMHSPPVREIPGAVEAGGYVSVGMARNSSLSGPPGMVPVPDMTIPQQHGPWDQDIGPSASAADPQRMQQLQQLQAQLQQKQIQQQHQHQHQQQQNQMYLQEQQMRLQQQHAVAAMMLQQQQMQAQHRVQHAHQHQHQQQQVMQRSMSIPQPTRAIVPQPEIVQQPPPQPQPQQQGQSQDQGQQQSDDTGDNDWPYQPHAPPLDDIDPKSESAPRQQKLRFAGDLYTPQWVRGTGNAKEGWCDTCRPGKWFQLKNSAFWYHKQFYHGISAVSGRGFVQPLEMRKVEGEAWEGMCHQCKQWVTVASLKRKNSVLWFKHAHKCHEYLKPVAKGQAHSRRGSAQTSTQQQ
ncbi:hypothetical protein YB2330_004858 [Saitoella coloradoensis]